MKTHNRDTCSSFTVPECTNDNHSHLVKLKQVNCCEVLIDFRTCLFPSPRHCDDISSSSCVDVKIDKVCGCKVLIGGVLHKAIKYIYKDCEGEPHKKIKYKDIPFSCYIDFDWAKADDMFKISGHEIICQFSELKKIKKDCSMKTIFIEKEIIKIAVQSN